VFRPAILSRNVTHSRISLPPLPQNLEVAVVLRKLIGQPNRLVHKPMSQLVLSDAATLLSFPILIRELGGYDHPEGLMCGCQAEICRW
jgi:hypothetical protein